jgi:tRNA G26 N,N-dimethylase Trm1
VATTDTGTAILVWEHADTALRPYLDASNRAMLTSVFRLIFVLESSSRWNSELGEALAPLIAHAERQHYRPCGQSQTGIPQLMFARL